MTYTDACAVGCKTYTAARMETSKEVVIYYVRCTWDPRGMPPLMCSGRNFNCKLITLLIINRISPLIWHIKKIFASENYCAAWKVIAKVATYLAEVTMTFKSSKDVASFCVSPKTNIHPFEVTRQRKIRH